MSTSRRRSAVLSAAAALVLVGCTAAPAPEASSDADAEGVTTVAAGLDVPWSIAWHGEVALVSERDTGRIVELAADGDVREVDVVDGVTPLGEGGLLGIAVHEDHLYAYLTAGQENRVARYELTGEPGSLALGPAEPILDGIPAGRTHNGGRLAFGPDGMLYVTVGDAGSPDAAQDLGSMSGKILRLTPDGEIPDDNPFPGSAVYSYGHRNPQGIAWGPDGTLYASEFGQDTWDELNVVEPGGNYGWPEVEGIAETEGFIDPVQQWPPSQASPSGIAIDRGSIWVANLRGERLTEVPLDDLGASTEHLVGAYGRLRDVAVGPDGALWLLTNNTDGRGDRSPDDDRVLRLDTRP